MRASFVALGQCQSSLAAHHCVMCAGSVQIFQTWAMVCSPVRKMVMRVMVLIRLRFFVVVGAGTHAAALIFNDSCLALFFQPLQVGGHGLGVVRPFQSFTSPTTRNASFVRLTWWDCQNFLSVKFGSSSKAAVGSTRCRCVRGLRPRPVRRTPGRGIQRSGEVRILRLVALPVVGVEARLDERVHRQFGLGSVVERPVDEQFIQLVHALRKAFLEAHLNDLFKVFRSLEMQ